MTSTMSLRWIAAVSALAVASAAPVFQETFDATWASRWTKSEWKTDEKTDGDFTLTAGKWYGDAEADQGIQTGPDARFFASYSELPAAFSNEGKDLVVQFSVKHEQKLDCGGGYIKLFPASISSEDMQKLSGDTPYSIMFGPDICGSSTKRIHVIINYKGTNYLIKQTIPCETDQLTHVYTLHIKPDNTLEVFVDTESKFKGSLVEDFEMLAPKQIKDPSASKPEDWDERKMIDDPEDKKPDGYDDTPVSIPDPEAKKPDDWDDEDDGEWEAPKIKNPEWAGPWTAKRIDNPAFQGIWSAPMIDNPEFVDDAMLYKQPPMKYVGFELWQVKAGSLFDNIIVTDSLEEAMTLAKDTWGKSKDAEKEMFDAAKAAEAKDAPDFGGMPEGGMPGGMGGMGGMPEDMEDYDDEEADEKDEL